MIGAGTLGSKIAATFSTRVNAVHLVDPNQEVLDKALAEITFTQKYALDHLEGSAQGTVTGFSTAQEAVQDSWLIIEAVPENFDLKCKVLAELDSLAKPEAIIVTNSSSYPSKELVTEVKHPERFANLHFFMVPFILSTEVMSDGQTSQQVMDTLLTELPKFGIFPFVAKQQSLGFIINRVWAAMKREALEVISEGVTTPEEFDALFASVYGLEIFRMIDLVGLDVALDIEQHYNAAYGTPEGPRKVLQKYISEGKLGIKSGEGFYTYK